MAGAVTHSFGSVTLPGKGFQFPWKDLPTHLMQNTKLTPFRLGRADTARATVKGAAEDKKKTPDVVGTALKMLGLVGVSATAAYLLRNRGMPAASVAAPNVPGLKPVPETDSILNRPLLQTAKSFITYPYHFLNNTVNPSGELYGLPRGSYGDKLLSENPVGSVVNRAVSGAIGGAGLVSLGKPLVQALRTGSSVPLKGLAGTIGKSIPLWHLGMSTLPGLSQAGKNVHEAISKGNVDPLKSLPSDISHLYTDMAKSDFHDSVPALAKKLHSGSQFSPGDYAKMWWHLASGNPLAMTTHATAPASGDSSSAADMELGRLAANTDLRLSELDNRTAGPAVIESHENPQVREALSQITPEDAVRLAELANVHQRMSERFSNPKLTRNAYGDAWRSLLGYDTVGSQWDSDRSAAKAFFDSPTYQHWQGARNSLLDSGFKDVDAQRLMGPIGGVTQPQIMDLSHYLRKLDAAYGN